MKSFMYFELSFFKQKLSSIFYSFYLKFKYKTVNFHHGSALNNHSLFEGNNSIGIKSEVLNSTLGFGSYVGNFCLLNNVKIGRYCSIGSSVRIIFGKHPTNIFVSTHPAFFSKSKPTFFTYISTQKFKEIDVSCNDFAVEIGNDVWMGENVSIMSGIKIGDGAIVGSNALVTKNIEPYTINIGIPSQSIKKRFTNEQIIFLLNYKWWNKDLEWIKNNAELFDDIEKFKSEVQK